VVKGIISVACSCRNVMQGFERSCWKLLQNYVCIQNSMVTSFDSILKYGTGTATYLTHWIVMVT